MIGTVSAALQVINQQVASTPEVHEELARWVRTNFAPALARLGAPAAADTPDKNLLRATLFLLLGDVGNDPRVVTQARQFSEQYLHEPGSIEGTLAATALTVAAQNGDAAFFEQLQRASQTAADPQLRIHALLALARFRDPELVIRALDYAVSTQVRNQDALRLIQMEMSDRRTQDVAWQYVRQNWSRVSSQITTSTGGSLVTSMGSFCSVDRSRELTDFFAEHTVPAASHALDEAHDSIADCVELRALQGQNLKRWLQLDAALTQPKAQPSKSAE